MATQPWRLTATEALAKIRARELTAEQYASSLLERIRQRDDDVRAWAFLDPAAVIEQAKQLDKVPFKERGPLHGLPVAVKDILYTKGWWIKSSVRREPSTDANRYANDPRLNNLQGPPCDSRCRGCKNPSKCWMSHIR